MTNVGKLLSAALFAARSKYQELYSDWIFISHSVGSRLPASRLASSIQRDGEVDVLLRSLEDEFATNDESDKQADIFALHRLNMLSEYWIGGTYETFRLLDDRELADKDDRFVRIFRDLELLRMPLEKHEIAKDRSIKQPITLMRQPPRHDASDEYRYATNDPKRAHIMPMGVSDKGSITWHVIDLKQSESRWIERRSLSNQIVELWRRPRSSDPGSP